MDVRVNERDRARERSGADKFMDPVYWELGVSEFICGRALGSLCCQTFVDVQLSDPLTS